MTENTLNIPLTLATDAATATTAKKPTYIELTVDTVRGPYAKVNTADEPYWTSLTAVLGIKTPEQLAWERAKRAAEQKKEQFDTPAPSTMLPWALRERFFRLRKQPHLVLGRESCQWSGINVYLGPKAQRATLFTWAADWVKDEAIGQIEFVLAANCVDQLGGAFAPTFGREASVAFFTDGRSEEDNWVAGSSGRSGALRPVKAYYEHGTCAPALWQIGSPVGASLVNTTTLPVVQFVVNGSLSLQPLTTLFAPDGNVGETPWEWLKAKKEAATLGQADPNTRQITLPGTDTVLMVKRRMDGKTYRLEVSVTEGKMLPHLGLARSGWFGKKTFSDVYFTSLDGFHWQYESFTARFRGQKPKHRHDTSVEDQAERSKEVVADEAAPTEEQKAPASPPPEVTE